MKRGSVIGPAILILIGIAFLVNNLKPELPLLRLAGQYWPWLLVGWGVARLVEITIWRANGRPLPRGGITGGEWALIVLLSLAGSSLYLGYHVKERWPNARLRMGGLEFLGETYDYPLAEQRLAAGAAPRVVVENQRGNTRVTAADGTEIRVSGRNSVRAFSRAEADKASAKLKLELVRQGDQIVVRTNQEQTEGSLRVSSDLEITVPKGAWVEGRGRYGDFDITGIEGDVTITGENSGVRLANIGGNVRAETRRSDMIRAVKVKGNVELKGNGVDIELEDIEGQTAIAGNYRGDISFRHIAKPVRYKSTRTDLRFERLPGSVQMTRGDFSVDDVVGPLYLRGSSKDVAVANLTGGADIEVDRGDISLRPGRLPLGRLDVRTGSGDISLDLPPAANFSLKAETGLGDIAADFAPAAPGAQTRAGKGSKFETRVGTGPEITLYTKRGDIAARKSGAEAVRPPAPPKPPALTVPKRTSI